jgi:hypothetical protein
MKLIQDVLNMPKYVHTRVQSIRLVHYTDKYCVLNFKDEFLPALINCQKNRHVLSGYLQFVWQ